MAVLNFTGQARPRCASTTLISYSLTDIRRIPGDGETATKLINQYCCGDCCLLKALGPDALSENFLPVVIPDNVASRNLNLRPGPLGLDSEPRRLCLIQSIGELYKLGMLALRIIDRWPSYRLRRQPP
jgi:hypothetical protein